MNSFVIRFHDDTPDMELRGVHAIAIAREKIRFMYLNPKSDGITTRTYKIEQIAYIEVGNG